MCGCVGVIVLWCLNNSRQFQSATIDCCKCWKAIQQMTPGLCSSRVLQWMCPSFSPHIPSSQPASKSDSCKNAFSSSCLVIKMSPIDFGRLLFMTGARTTVCEWDKAVVTTFLAITYSSKQQYTGSFIPARISPWKLSKFLSARYFNLCVSWKTNIIVNRHLSKSNLYVSQIQHMLFKWWVYQQISKKPGNPDHLNHVCGRRETFHTSTGFGHPSSQLGLGWPSRPKSKPFQDAPIWYQIFA